MYRSVALKAWEKAALAATALSLGSAATCFVEQLQPSATISTAKPSYARNSDRCYPKPRIGTALSSLRMMSSPFVLSRVECQQQHATWDSEESTDYHYEKMTLPTRAVGVSHVIFGQLLQEGCIESYEVYRRVSDKIGEIAPEVVSCDIRAGGERAPEVVLCDIRLGNKLDGHTGVVHGGIIALLFDDGMGFAFDAMGIEMAVTAHLNIDFRAPVPANSRVVVRVRLRKQEGRKLYFSAQLTSLDSTIMYAEATSLYIIPKAVYEATQK